MLTFVDSKVNCVVFLPVDVAPEQKLPQSTDWYKKSQLPDISVEEATYELTNDRSVAKFIVYPKAKEPVSQSSSAAYDFMVAKIDKNRPLIICNLNDSGRIFKATLPANTNRKMMLTLMVIAALAVLAAVIYRNASAASKAEILLFPRRNSSDLKLMA